MGLIVRREELAALEPEWRELLAACPGGRVFLSPSWLRTWWAEFGAGREMMLLSVRDDQRLVGVVPLMRDDDALTFAGDTKVCDYMDFLCLPGREPELISSLFQALGEERWSNIRLWAMREDSPALAALPAACTGSGLRFQREPEDVCPQAQLPTDWETYVNLLDKKHRHELRRKLRKLPQAGDVHLEVLVAPEDIAAALDDFLRMHRASRADKAAFMTEQMERFFRDLVCTLAIEGAAEMVFLKLGGRRTAAVMCFLGDDETLLYNSGYDPDFAQFSVGLLSKALTLQRAIEQGKKRFDFLRGPERYKYELGAKDFTVYRARVSR